MIAVSKDINQFISNNIEYLKILLISVTIQGYMGQGTVMSGYKFSCSESLRTHRLNYVACMYGTCGSGSEGSQVQNWVKTSWLFFLLSPSFIHSSTLPSQKTKTKNRAGYYFKKNPTTYSIHDTCTAILIISYDIGVSEKIQPDT